MRNKGKGGGGGERWVDHQATGKIAGKVQRLATSLVLSNRKYFSAAGWRAREEGGEAGESGRWVLGSPAVLSEWLRLGGPLKSQCLVRVTSSGSRVESGWAGGSLETGNPPGSHCIHPGQSQGALNLGAEAGSVGRSGQAGGAEETDGTVS